VNAVILSGATVAEAGLTTREVAIADTVTVTEFVPIIFSSSLAVTVRMYVPALANDAVLDFAELLVFVLKLTDAGPVALQV
jgi:hypothetical protein